MSEDNNSLLLKRRKEVADERAEIPEIEPHYERLALHILNTFRRNSDFRRASGVDADLLKSLQMSRNKYSDEELANFRAKGVPIVYLPIADMKKRAVYSMMSEIFNNPGDKPWTLSATPVPDIREDVSEKALEETKQDFLEYASATGVTPSEDAVKQYVEDRWTEIMDKEKEFANDKVAVLERLVHDKMIEGGWIKAFDDYLLYLCTYGTAVIKSPILRTVKRKEVTRSEDGSHHVKMVDKQILCYEAISPFDCYPEEGAKSISQGNFCIKSRYTPKDLWLFSRQEGKEWQPDNIRYILCHHSDGGVTVERPEDDARERYQYAMDNLIDETCLLEGIEYYGDARGSWLIELGFTEDTNGDDLDIESYYEVSAICVDGKIVYCKIIDPEVGRPLSKGTFYPIVDSWWGEGVFLKCECSQKIANSAVRDLVVNMAQASGPQTIIKSMNRLHPKCSLASEPWKVWFFNDSPIGQNDNPMTIFQPQSNARELSYIVDFCMKQADNDTGIPSYTYGSTIAGGAGRTSSGLAMLMESVNRGVKAIVAGTDRDVIRDTVKRTADWMMLHEPSDMVIGDCEVNPAGVSSLVFRETESNRRKEFLGLSVNPAIAQVLLPTGIAVLIRKEAESLGVNPDLIVPSPERLKELDEISQARAKMQMIQQAMMPQQQEMGGPNTGGQPPQPQISPEAQGMIMGGGGGAPMGGEGGAAIMLGGAE